MITVEMIASEVLRRDGCCGVQKVRLYAKWAR